MASLTYVTVIVQAKKPEQKEMFKTQAPIIVALTKGAGQALFVTEDSEVPHGCGTETVTADVNVHIPVQGKVDAAAEVSKLEKKQAFAEQGREKILKLTQQSNYETAVREEVRAQNAEKVGSTKGFSRQPSSILTCPDREARVGDRGSPSWYRALQDAPVGVDRGSEKRMLFICSAMAVFP